MTDEKHVPPGEFDSLREGDSDPELKKTIKYLIMVDRNFIVYLDEDLYVEWTTSDGYEWPRDAGAIMNRYGYLEVLAEPVASDTRLRIQRLLGESVARIFDDRDAAAANAILDRAEAILCNPARYRYIAAATAVAAVAAAVVFVLWIGRDRVQGAIGVNAFQVALACGMGAIGALMSVIMRTRSIAVDPAEPAAAQYAEGVYRAVIGMVGGLLIGLAIKADFAFGFLSQRGTALIALCGAIAGVSERLVPSLVRRVEESVSRGGRKTPSRKKSRRKQP